MQLIFQKGNRIIFPFGKDKPFYTYNDNISEIEKFILDELNLNIISIIHKKHFSALIIADYNRNFESLTINSFIKNIDNFNIDDNEFNKELLKYLNEQKDNSNIKLLFGIRDGKVVSINDITEYERGLKCQCYCPGCGEPLQARLGKVKQKHFAHNNANCNLASAQQSALHLLAKEILQQENKMTFPELSVRTSDVTECVNYEYVSGFKNPKYTHIESKTITFDNVILEHKISDIIPDIIVEKNGKQCLVEIAVTHYIDKIKQEKIKAIGLPVIEIDLGSIANDLLDTDALRKLIVYGTDNKRWCYHPEYRKAYLIAFEKFTEEYNQIINDREEKRIQKEERAERANKLVKKLVKDNNYQEWVLRLRNDKEFNQKYSLLQMSKCLDITPFFIDIPISFEMIFDCDRRIWQSELFEQFIFNRDSKNRVPQITVDKIKSWAEKYAKSFKINDSLHGNAFIMKNNVFKSRDLLFEVIRTYINYLAYIGFVKKADNYNYGVISTHTIIPKYKGNAMLLQGAIEEVTASPAVDDEIQSIIKPSKYITNKYYARELSPQKRIQWQQDINYSIQYQKGQEEVINYDDFPNCLLKDSFGHSWAICVQCGNLMRDDEMVYINGNEGICRNCNANT